MKDGYRFVDCDMHIMEPMDLFDKYLDPEFKPSITPEIAGEILSGGARLYGFGDDDFDKAAAAARRHDNIAARA
jgi:hypothetical protein